jgi:hypothetical protein
MTFTLTQEQYEALIALAREGAAPDRLVELEEWLKEIEDANGITRSFLWVQWQEADAPLPPGTRFPEEWPPELRRSIELITRRVARADVDAVLDQYANDPVTVLVTPDPAGRVGWTPVDDFFVT